MEINQYDITMGNDVARDIHCAVTMNNDIAMCTYHGITMHNDVAMNIFYDVFFALCLIMILLWVVWNKNKNKFMFVLVWAGEHIRCFCVGLFHKSEGRVKYPYTNTTHVLSPDRSNTHLFLLYDHIQL